MNFAVALLLALPAPQRVLMNDTPASPGGVLTPLELASHEDSFWTRRARENKDGAPIGATAQIDVKFTLAALPPADFDSVRHVRTGEAKRAGGSCFGRC